MKRVMILLLVVTLLAASTSPLALAAEVCYPTAVEESEDGHEIRKVRSEERRVGKECL